MSISTRFLSDERLWQDVLLLAIRERETNIVRQLVLRGVKIEKHHLLTLLNGDTSDMEILDLLAPEYYHPGDDNSDFDEEEDDEDEDEDEDEEEIHETKRIDDDAIEIKEGLFVEIDSD